MGYTPFEVIIKILAIFPVKSEVKVLVTQLCLTLCDPMDCNLPGSTIHGTFEARVLEWGAIEFYANQENNIM